MIDRWMNMFMMDMFIYIYYTLMQSCIHVTYILSMCLPYRYCFVYCVYIYIY